MKDGIINVYKPKSMTSNDVIYKVRAALGIKKLGHTGTLDPMAEGVLPILINRGTRIAEYLDWDLKTYVSTVRLGIRTDSLDITGAVEKISDPSGVTETDVANAFCELFRDGSADLAENVFSGVLDQIPPMTSAVRINGRRLYEYVHQGEEIPDEIRQKIRPRRVWVENLKIEDISLPEITFSVTCSKGTYIRSISRDIGEILGCGAVMTSLERSASGAFNEGNAVSLDEFVKAAVMTGKVTVEDTSVMRLRRTEPFGDEIPEELEKYVLGVDFPLVNFGEALVSPENARRFLDGWHLGYNEIKIIRKPAENSWIMALGHEAETYHMRETEINSGSHAGLKLHPEYFTMYRIYRDDGGGARTFVGIARHSDKYHKLVPDKVFLRI